MDTESRPVRAAGKRIRIMREERRWTQKELARRVSVDRSYISQIENGVAMPAIPVVGRIAAALGVDLTDLLEDQEKECRIDLGRVDLDWWINGQRLTDEAKRQLFGLAQSMRTEDAS